MRPALSVNRLELPVIRRHARGQAESRRVGVQYPQVVFGRRLRVIVRDLFLHDLDHGSAGDARQDGALAGRGPDLTVDLEHDVHAADFLDVLALLAVQPQHLAVAHGLGLLLADHGAGVVAAALGEARAALDGSAGAAAVQGNFSGLLQRKAAVLFQQHRAFSGILPDEGAVPAFVII